MVDRWVQGYIMRFPKIDIAEVGPFKAGIIQVTVRQEVTLHICLGKIRLDERAEKELAALQRELEKDGMVHFAGIKLRPKTDRIQFTEIDADHLTMFEAAIPKSRVEQSNVAHVTFLEKTIH